MKQNHNFLAFTFGPIGDTLMILALFDDILTLDPDAKFVILSRKNLGLIRDLAQQYPMVEVREIPGGFSALPFFASLLLRRWILLTIGVAGVYSMRLKLFFLALSLLPGNKTLGFNDRGPGKKGWLPLDVVLQFEGSIYIIDNFRRLLNYVFDPDTAAKLRGRPPHVLIAQKKPASFALEEGKYIAANYFSNSSLRSLPLYRWERINAEIAKAFPDYTLVLLGGPADAASVAQLAKKAPQAVPMAGLPLTEAAWVVDHAALYVGVDTGITHLAGVLQQKSLVLSHFRIPTWRPTYNPHARAIANSKRCECAQGGACVVEEEGVRYGKCMYDISDHFVLESIGLALSSQSREVSSYAGFFDENK